MAVAYQSISAATIGSDASAETAAPSGVVSGDCLLLFLYIRSGPTRVAPTGAPTGWTLADSAIDASSTYGDVYVYWRIADGSGDDTPAVSLDGSPGGGWFTRIVRFDGTDATTPVDDTATANDDSASDTADIPVATAARNGSMAVCFAGKVGNATDYDQVWPSGWTEIFDDHSAGGYRSYVSGGYDAIDAGAMSSGQDISGWSTSSNVVSRVTVILQPPATTSYTLTADPGSYTLTGTAANLEYHRKVQAASGSISVTGTAANLERHLEIAAQAGSVVIDGKGAGLEVAKLLSAAAGSISINGTDANLRVGINLAAGPGAVAISGTAAALQHDHVVSAAAGSVVINGTAATLARARRMTAESGLFSINGTSANLLWERILSASPGAMSLTGTAATLTYTPASTGRLLMIRRRSVYQ